MARKIYAKTNVLPAQASNTERMERMTRSGVLCTKREHKFTHGRDCRCSLCQNKRFFRSTYMQLKNKEPLGCCLAGLGIARMMGLWFAQRGSTCAAQIGMHGLPNEPLGFAGDRLFFRGQSA
jgi:hypothetical protein